MLHQILVAAGMVGAGLLAGPFHPLPPAHAQALPDSNLYAQSRVRSGPHSATRPAGSSTPTRPAGSTEPTRPAGSSEPTPPAGGAGRSGSVRGRAAPVDPWAGYVERNAFGTPLERRPVTRPTRTVEEQELEEQDPRRGSRFSDAGTEEAVADPTQGNPWARQASEAIRNPALPGAQRDSGSASGEGANAGAELEPFGMRSPEYQGDTAGESEWSGQSPSPYAGGADASGDRSRSTEAGMPAYDASGEPRTRPAPQVDTYLPAWEPIR